MKGKIFNFKKAERVSHLPGHRHINRIIKGWGSGPMEEEGHFVRKTPRPSGWLEGLGDWEITKKGPTGETLVYDQNKDSFKAETVKLLHIAKDKQLSLHFHVKKTEAFYMVKGAVDVYFVDQKDNKLKVFLLDEGQSVLIEPGFMHSMEGLRKENLLLEVSTYDTPEDSYRIIKGD